MNSEGDHILIHSSLAEVSSSECVRQLLEGEVVESPKPGAHDGVDEVGAGADAIAAVVRVAGAHVSTAVHAPQVELAAAQERLVLPVRHELLRGETRVEWRM